MKNILPVYEDNIGGLELVLFTEWENLDFSGVLEMNGLAIQGNLVMKPGKVWYQMAHTRHTAEYEEQTKTDRRGTIYPQSLEGQLPKDYPELGSQLFDMVNRRWAVLFRDRNGYLRLAGSPEHGLRFNYKLSTGKNPGDLNGNKVSFEGDSLKPAFYYSGNFTVSEIGLVEPQPIGGGSGAPVIIKDGAGNIRATVQPGQTFIINSGFSWGFRIL